MNRRALLGVFGALVLAGCGTIDGSGACVKPLSGRTYDYCLNFRNSGGRTGEAICTEQQGAWSPGMTCQSLGYTKECRANSWFKPASTCI
jgi:hypothetical protein